MITRPLFILQIIDQHLPDHKSTSFAQQLTTGVVELCHSRLAECVINKGDIITNKDDIINNTNNVNEVPKELVDETDFECILCTG